VGELTETHLWLLTAAVIVCGIAGGLLLRAYNSGTERNAFRARGQQADSAEKPSGGGCLGALLIFGGLLVACYYFVLFDVAVDSGVGRVVNLGKMHERTIGLIVGFGLMIFGAVLRR
jgi:hypothetical protein